jgi:hypothetical protein
MLWINTESTEPNLTTLQALQEQVSIETSNEDMALRLIARASRWAETYVGYPLRCRTYGETVPGTGGQSLRVSATPIRAVTLVMDATSTGTATDLTTSLRIEDADAGLLSRDEGFAWTAGLQQAITPNPVPGWEQRPWYVVYEAGYVLGGKTSTGGGTTSTGETLPGDIQQAVIEKVKEWYGGESGVVSKKVGDLSITYKDVAQGPAESLLEPYRRMV